MPRGKYMGRVAKPTRRHCTNAVDFCDQMIYAQRLDKIKTLVGLSSPSSSRLDFSSNPNRRAPAVAS